MILPALALSRGAEIAVQSKDEAFEIAKALLFGERPLAEMIAVAKEWRGHLGDMAAAVSAKAPLRPSVATWAPVFSDAAYADLAIAVLTRASELVDEGANRPDPNGIDGLGTPLLQNASACRAKRSRIVSLRRIFPGGRFERLAAAEIKITDGRTRGRIQITRPDGSGEIMVVDERTGDAGVKFGHRCGRRKRHPPVETFAVFERYVAGLKHVPLPLAVAPDPAGEETISEEAGYDVYAPGAFKTAVSAWAPFWTAPQRTMTASDFAAMLECAEASAAV